MREYLIALYSLLVTGFEGEFSGQVASTVEKASYPDAVVARQVDDDETLHYGQVAEVESVEERDDRIVAICSRGSERQAISLLDLPLPSPLPPGAEWIEAYVHWSRF